MLRYFLFKIAFFLAHITPLRVAYGLARCLTETHHFFSIQDKRCITENLKVILDDPVQIPRVRKDVFLNFGRYLVEFFRTDKHFDLSFVKNNVTIEGSVYLDQLKQNNQGGIFVTAHIGNWEMGGLALSLLGFPITAIALSHKEKKVNALFNRQRQNKGVRVVQTDQAIRVCMEALKKREYIALVGDRVFTAHGTTMPFFGKPTLIPKGTALFALKRNKPIVPTFFVRDGYNHFRLIVHEPIDVQRVSEGLSEDEAVRKVIEAYLRIIESMIKAYPGQWLMFRKFSES